MKNLRKLSSFTLTEMLVVLAITSIVVGLAFVILNLFGRNVQIIQNNYSHTTEIQLLEQQLTVDFNTFHDISIDPTSEKLNLKTVIDARVYEISLGHIIRDNDTLYKGPVKTEYFYQGIPVRKGPVDAIKINMVSVSRNQSIFVYKVNDAANTLNIGI